jgi:hypothetical protein
MKQLVVRLQVVELDDHDTNLIPDEITLYQGEKAVLDEQYNYENINELEVLADEAIQLYADMEDRNEYDAADELDYDEMIKDEKLGV